MLLFWFILHWVTVTLNKIIIKSITSWKTNWNVFIKLSELLLAEAHEHRREQIPVTHYEYDSMSMTDWYPRAFINK